MDVDELDQDTTRLVSFQDRRDLLRGSRLSTVMRHKAAVFDITDSPESFDLSEVVTDIAMFISHNWSVPHISKFFCLAVHYNFYLAWSVAVAALLAIIAATAEGHMPMIAVDGGRAQQGIVGTLSVAPIFLLTMVSGHKLRRFIGCCDPHVFLDKTCVHQTNAQLQQDAIMKLGAFIKCSSRMFIVYTDIYLQKLWTTYEVACFLSLHPTRNMVVMPPSYAMTVLGVIAGGYSSRVFAVFLQWSLVTDERSTLVVFEILALTMTISMGAAFFRHLARMKEALLQRLQHFKVEQCRCAVEEDRPIVYRNIALLMLATGLVGSDASDDDTLEAFNEVVREKLSCPLSVAIGYKYAHLVATHVTCMAPYYIEHLFAKVDIPDGREARQRICVLLFASAWAFGGFPLCALGMQRWCGRCLHLSGWREGSFLTIGVLLFTASTFAITLFHEAMLSLAVHGDVGFVIMILILVMSTSLALVAFAREQRPRRR